ncbi:hypothetical protein C8Q74DRAFT_1363698 [Fomes fomentarius]|nr:hypothetical protein C8Q74DRAFT_1363698 [Fomes fomentarius]
MTPLQFQEYIPVPDDFETVYPQDRIKEIAEMFKAYFALVMQEQDDVKDKKGTPLEKIVSDIWVEMNNTFSLFPGYIFHLSESTEPGDSKGYKIDATLISDQDRDLITVNVPNWFLQRLPMEFKRGGTENDPFDDRGDHVIDPATPKRRHVRGQIMSYSQHVFVYQHRAWLFQILINGEHFRMLRWDRSGVIVTDAIDYVNDIAGTRLLLEFLHGFIRLSDRAQGLDPTAVRLAKDSCAWNRMQTLAFSNLHDVHYKERVFPAPELPSNFTKPTRDPPESSLFNDNLLHPDPCTPCDPAVCHRSSAFRLETPVWTYVRKLFYASLQDNFPRYQLTVGGRKYLVGKPIFQANGMVSRATRGYIALDWTAQRFVFLKDAWRPFYADLTREGDVLDRLNKASVPHVPTLIGHEDVCQEDGQEQETETSKYAPDAPQELRKIVARTSTTTTAGKRIIEHKRPTVALPGRRPATSTTSSRQGSSSLQVKASSISASDAGPSIPQSNNQQGSRGTKRTARDAEIEQRFVQGSGLRHLRHYRIVVAEVCLPSTAFDTGGQWVNVILCCLKAHRAAYEKCSTIHRDISVGNILILPVVYTLKDGRKVVFFTGVLGDWELAKDVTVRGARQPERTATWQFMSVRCASDTSLEVEIADEIESFCHVTLYNAVRFLLHNIHNICPFIKSYFDDAELDGLDNHVAPHMKREAIEKGRIIIVKTELVFTMPGGSTAGHPINDLFKQLFTLLQARYRVLDWKAAQEAAAKTSQAAQDTLRKDASCMSMNAVLESVQNEDDDIAAEDDELTLPLNLSSQTATVLAPPSPQDTARAGALDTHREVIRIFQNWVYQDGIWPTNDKVADRLHGYRPAARVSPSVSTKLAKQAKTMPVGSSGRDQAKGKSRRRKGGVVAKPAT